MSQQIKKLAILVGGGPAPGINSVIGAATIRGALSGAEVLGIRDGFKWIMDGNIEHVTPLTIDAVSRIHFRGGSHIGISRANPTKNEKDLENCVISLLRLNVDKLITIGGDDTAYSAYKLEERSRGRIRVVHVPKDDRQRSQPARRYLHLRLPDCPPPRSGYCEKPDGGCAHHIALVFRDHDGPQSGPSGAGNRKSRRRHCDADPGRISTTGTTQERLSIRWLGQPSRRMSDGRMDGVAILAEGLVEALITEDLKGIAGVERDAHDNLRIAEINFSEILKAKVLEGLKKYNLKTTIVAKNIGYELRCADPIPFDMEYTRDLGYCAAKYLDEGGNAVMITIQEGLFKPLLFSEMMDPKTGKTRVRMVDINSERYKIARRYMIRLRRDDFQDPHELAKVCSHGRHQPRSVQGRFRIPGGRRASTDSPGAAERTKEGSIMKEWKFRPIGPVKSPYTDTDQIPRGLGAEQPADGAIEILARFEKGLLDIEGFSHFFVLWIFDRVEGFDLMASPPSDSRVHGVFATRSPHRPNPVGLTVVELLRREGRILHVRGVDMLNETPVIDIKPYLSGIAAENRAPWLAG